MGAHNSVMMLSLQSPQLLGQFNIFKTSQLSCELKCLKLDLSTSLHGMGHLPVLDLQFANDLVKFQFLCMI